MHSMFRKGKSGMMAQDVSGKITIVKGLQDRSQDQDNGLRIEGHCKIPETPEICQDRAYNVRTFRAYPVKG
jgi:hypothetical protein